MMLSGYYVLTLTHRQAPLSAIGKLVPTAESAQARLEALKQAMNWEELLCLTTCNRVMFGFYSTEKLNLDLLRFEFVAAYRPDFDTESIEELAGRLQCFQGGDAVRHIFEVAASMDSLVIGEREIVRQLREAYERCADWGLTGDHFRLLMRHALEVSKQVCTETGIGDKALSVVALAYGQMLRSGITSASHLLMVGAGETNILMGKILLKNGFTRITVANRTLENAAMLAATFKEGQSMLLADLGQQSLDFDAMIVCTASTLPVITPENYALLCGDDTRQKVVIDLSVPHNVAPEVVSQFDVQYIEIENLRERAAEHLSYRESARQQAVQIITDRLIAYREVWHQRQVERSMLPMVEAIKQAKTMAIETVFAKEMAALDPQAQALIHEMMAYMEKKAVAIPIKAIRDIATKMSAHASASRPTHEALK